MNPNLAHLQSHRWSKRQLIPVACLVAIFFATFARFALGLLVPEVMAPSPSLAFDGQLAFGLVSAAGSIGLLFVATST